MSSQQSSHLLTFLVLLSRYWHGPGAWYWQWNTSPQSLADDTPPPASWWQVTDPNPHLHMVTGTGSQSHTNWAGWLTLTLSVVTHCSSSAININTWLLLAILFWKCSYWWQWHGAWKLLSQFVSRWPTVTVTLKTSSLSLVAFSISIGIYQPHDVLQPLHGPLPLHWPDTNQHQQCKTYLLIM